MYYRKKQVRYSIGLKQGCGNCSFMEQCVPLQALFALLVLLYS
jgi:hypothetical protein